MKNKVGFFPLIWMILCDNRGELLIPDKDNRSGSTVAVRNPGLCFAALKLIEQLARDGHIPAYMFRAIVNDYADIVDVSQFMIYGKENENV